MDNNIPNFPSVPNYVNQSYTSNGKPVIDTTAVVSNNKGSLGASFSGLIGSDVTVPMGAAVHDGVITETTTKKRRKKKSEDSDSTAIATTSNNDIVESDPVNSKEIVENTVYADTYTATNNMTYGIIGQADQLLNDCKRDLDYIRSQRSMRGKYHYINATVSSMTQLLSTKLSAIKEINSTIKTANDSEYRRFKDMRAINDTDDNKAIMDAYTAFISAPVGAPQYNLPGTAALTGGLNGIIPAAIPADVQAGVDQGMAQYLSTLSPEENLMLNDANKDIEEVIVYDEASGAKRFQWMNTRTGEMINNMPISSNLTLDDFNIDTRTRLAKNNNLNEIKKVVIQNGSSFNGF